VVDTLAVIEGLKSGKIGNLGLDVYEEEESLFFEDLSNMVIQDDVFSRLITFPNVIVTGHQAFFTRNAMEEIAAVTLSNLADFESGKVCPNRVTAEHHWDKPARRPPDARLRDSCFAPPGFPDDFDGTRRMRGHRGRNAPEQEPGDP
jgi:hypothetical protein